MHAHTADTDQLRDHWSSRPTLDTLLSHDIAHLRADFLRRLFPAVAGLKVLDAGSGPAHDSLVFSLRGAEVTALDISKAALETADQIYADLDLPLTAVRADARDMPFDDNSFDLAFNAGVLEHFTDDQLEKVIDQMIRVVRPGGVVLAFCPNRYNVLYQRHLRKLDKHSYEFERAFTAWELRQRLLARGLPTVRLSGVHVHPTPNYVLPPSLPKYHRFEPWCRKLATPLEKAWRLHRLKSLLGQDFVAWAEVPEQLGPKRSIVGLGGGTVIREHGQAA